MRVWVRERMCDDWRAATARASRVLLLLVALCASGARVAPAQESVPAEEAEFGPVVRAYLGYLRAEQVVTDDRASRREVSAAYVRRNSNRVRALRATALRIARETKNDYLPELYAVARDELHTLFEQPPRPEAFRVGEVINNTFRFLGQQRTGEQFYVFARLDIYEQAELMKDAGGDAQKPDTPKTDPQKVEAPQPDARNSDAPQPDARKSAPGRADAPQPAGAQGSGDAATRPRRVAGRDGQSQPPPSPRTDKP